MQKITIRSPKAGTAPIPKSRQIGFDGNRKSGIEFPNKGANSQERKVEMNSMPILRPSVAMPRSVQAPIINIANNKAESPENMAKAIIYE